jgi:hypothetical protein
MQINLQMTALLYLGPEFPTPSGIRTGDLLALAKTGAVFRRSKTFAGLTLQGIVKLGPYFYPWW